VQYSTTGGWEKLSSTAVDIATGKMRGAAGVAQTAGESAEGPVLAGAADKSARGPGGKEFKPVAKEDKGLR
jgi:hypothetical protein